MNDRRDQMAEFAVQWAYNWNRGDVAAVISHFAEDALFTSPLAERIVGSAALRGKTTLNLLANSYGASCGPELQA